MTKSELALDFRGASSKKAPRQRGVCVEHLNRCKLLTADVTFLLISFLPLGNRNLPTIRFSWMFFHFISLHFTSFHFHFISFHFHFHFHFISFHFCHTAGGHGSIHQSVANEATDVWRGYAV